MLKICNLYTKSREDRREDVLYKQTDWFLMKLKLNSVSLIRHLRIAMPPIQNPVLVESGFRSKFSASADELRGGCRSRSLAALFTLKDL